MDPHRILIGRIRSLLIALASILWIVPLAVSGRMALNAMGTLTVEVESSLHGHPVSLTLFDLAAAAWWFGSILLAVTVFIWSFALAHKLWPVRATDATTSVTTGNS